MLLHHLWVAERPPCNCRASTWVLGPPKCLKMLTQQSGRSHRNCQPCPCTRQIWNQLFNFLKKQGVGFCSTSTVAALDHHMGSDNLKNYNEASLFKVVNSLSRIQFKVFSFSCLKQNGLNFNQVPTLHNVPHTKFAGSMWKADRILKPKLRASAFYSISLSVPSQILIYMFRFPLFSVFLKLCNTYLFYSCAFCKRQSLV